MNLVPVLQPRAAGIAVDLLAEAVADDPEAAAAVALMALLVPAVAGALVKGDVGVLARDRAVRMRPFISA